MDDKNFPRTKTIEIFLIFLGIGTLFLGFWRLNNTVKGVLEKQPNYYQHNSADDYKTKEDMDKLIKLQTTDTDKDGISDYDELNVYHTSIYLADTDSDGINDKEEIDSGDNPNCPRGKDCSLSSEANNSSNNLSDPSSVFKNSPTGEEIYLKNSDNDLNEKEYDFAKKIMSGEATLEEVKQMLLDSGISQEDLSKIPDDDIMEMYYKMLEENLK